MYPTDRARPGHARSPPPRQSTARPQPGIARSRLASPRLLLLVEFVGRPSGSYFELLARPAVVGRKIEKQLRAVGESDIAAAHLQLPISGLVAFDPEFGPRQQRFLRPAAP